MCKGGRGQPGSGHAGLAALTVSSAGCPRNSSSIICFFSAAETPLGMVSDATLDNFTSTAVARRHPVIRRSMYNIFYSTSSFACTQFVWLIITIQIAGHCLHHFKFRRNYFPDVCALTP